MVALHSSQTLQFTGRSSLPLATLCRELSRRYTLPEFLINHTPTHSTATSTRDALVFCITCKPSHEDHLYEIKTTVPPSLTTSVERFLTRLLGSRLTRC